MDVSGSSYGRRSQRSNQLSRLLDHKWRFIPFLAELEPEENEYSQTLLWTGVIVDILQVLSLVVMPEHVWSSAMKGFTVALNLVHIPIFRIGTLNAWIGSMMLCLLGTAGYVSFLIYMAYRCIMMKRFVVGSSTFDCRVFRSYRHMLSLFSTVLFIPLTENYLGLAFRSLDSDALLWYGSISTSSVLWSFGVTVCCVGMAIHVTLSFILWSLCMQPSTHSEHPLRAANSFPDTLYVLYKAVSCILYNQFYAMDQMIFHAIWICVASTILLIIFMVLLPYYNQRMGKIRVATLWICTIYSFLGLSSHIETAALFYREHNGTDLIIFLATLPFFTAFVYRYLTLLRVSSSYKKALQGLKEGKLLFPVVYFPKNLPRYPHFFSHNRILLEGIESIGYPWNSVYTDDLDPEIAAELIKRRQFEREKMWETSNDLDWQALKRERFAIRNFVMPYIDYIFFESDVELSTRFLENFERLIPVKLSGYQLRYAAILYIKGLHQFDYSGDVHLAYIHFLVDQANQHSVAMDEIQLLEKRELSLFVSYRLWKLEAEVASATRIKLKNQVSALTSAKEMHSTSLQRVVELWHILMQESLVEEKKLMWANSVLMDTRATAREDYENYLYHNAGNLEALCCYAVFADQLLGDKDVSNQCLQFVQQFVQRREVAQQQGSQIQASITASAEQLKLSLRNSRKFFYAIKKRSNIRLVHLALLGMLAIVICLNLLVLLFVFLKRSHVETSRTDIFRWGQIRTLGAQIGLQATTVYHNSLGGTLTSLDDKKDLLGLMADFDALFNNVVFSPEARASARIYSALREQPSGSFEGVVYNTWTYLGIAFANMNNLLGGMTSPSDVLTMRAKWLAKDFTSELNLLINMVISENINQMEDDLSTLNTVTRICMVVALVIEVSIFAMLLYGYFYVKGIHSLVYAVMSLLPKSEIRNLYHRTIGQHGDLGVFLKMRPQEKVNRLLAVLHDPEMFSLHNMRTGLLLPSLFSVVPSDRGDGKYVSRLLKKKNEELGDVQFPQTGRKDGKDGTPNVNSMNIDSEEDQLGEAEKKMKPESDNHMGPLDRFMVTDFLDEDEGESPGMASSWDVDLIEEAISAKDGGGSLRSTTRQKRARSTFRGASEQEYENVVSSHAFLLRSDKNKMERLFTPCGLLLFLLIILLLAASIVLGVTFQKEENSISSYNKQEFKKNELFMDAFSVMYSTTLAVANFGLSGDQRYFKKYIAAQSSVTWSNFREAVTPMSTLGVGVSATDPFEVDSMHRGLFEVTDIVMRLLCTEYVASCVTDVPFDEIYLSTLAWGTESTLTMIKLAPGLGLYNTFFNVLEGSTEDLQKSAEDQTEAALSILFSDVFNSYLTSFFEKATKLNTSSQDIFHQRIQIFLIACIVLSAVTCAVIAIEFGYNACRKRKGRHLAVQIGISGTMVALCVVSLAFMVMTKAYISNSTINDELDTARSLYENLSPVVFSIVWTPLMYIASGGAIFWNNKFKTTWLGTNFTLLREDLSSITGSNMIPGEVIFRLENEVMIPVVLMYEATKNLPELAEDVGIFSPDYLNSFTWDFEAESDYLYILGKYYLVTPDDGFYSNRATDLALTDPKKIELAKNTLVSYRTDDLIDIFLEALRHSDDEVSRKYSDAGTTIQRAIIYGNIYIYLSVAAAVILVLSNLELFVRYCRNMVSVKHIFAVTMGNEFSSAEYSKMGSSKAPNQGSEGSTGIGGKVEGNGADPKGVATSKSPSKSLVNAVENSTSNSLDGGALNDQTMEVKHAGPSSQNGDDIPAANGNIMESVSFSTSKKTDRVYTIASFMMVLILIVFSTVVLIMVPVYSTRMIRFVNFIDEAGQRRYFVVNTMNMMNDIQLDKSSYGVTSKKLRNAYISYIDLVNKMYFGEGSETEGRSRLTFVNLEPAQDELLFSRNRFYDNQTFYGTSMSSTTLDGIQVINSDFDGNNDEEFLSSNYFCSFSSMMNYMTYYSRGVGITADGLWMSYLRQCFYFNLTACASMTFKYAKDVFDPLLIGLQQSDDLLMAFILHSGGTVFGVILAVILLSTTGIVVMYLFVFAPFCQCLLQDDADSRMLLQVLPAELRCRYPVFEELLEGKKLSKEDNQLHRIMSELACMAVIAMNEVNGIIIRFNEMAEELLGYPASEVLGKSISILLQNDRGGERVTQERAYELLREARSSSKNHKHDVQLRRKNGQAFTASMRFLVVDMKDGSHTIVIFLEEVEDRARLNVLSKINRAILEMHEDGIIHIDSSGIILDANPSCNRIFGWRAEELVKQNVTILMPKAVGAYHQEYIKRYLERGVKKKIDNLTKIEGVHRDGSIVPLEIIVKEIVPPFPSALTQFVAYLRGKETEQEMESASALMDMLHTLSPVPLIQVNANGEVQQLSRSAAELFQYKAREVLAYTLPLQFLVPENIEGTHQESFIQRAHHRGPTSVIAQKRDRTTFPGVATVRQIEYCAGLPYNIFVGYISDISKTLRMEKSGRMAYSIMVQGVLPVIVVDQRGNIKFFNAAATKCFLFTGEEVIGKSYRILCGGRNVEGRTSKEEGEAEVRDEMEDWLDPENEEYKSGERKDLYNRRRLVYGQRRTGVVFPAELVMTKVPPLNQNDEAVVILLRDLTEEKAIQRNYYMGELMDSLCPMGIVVIDSNGRIERFSPAAEDCFGYHSSEIIGAPVQTIIPGIATKTAAESTVAGAAGEKSPGPLIDKGSKKLLPVGKEGNDGKVRIENMVEKVIIHIHGRHFDTRSLDLILHTVELSSIFASNFSPGAAVDSSYVLYCDNASSERDIIEATNFYRCVRDVVDSPMLQANESGKIVYVNLYAVSLFGYPTSDALMNKSVAVLFSPSGRERIQKRLKQTVTEFRTQRTNRGSVPQDGTDGAVAAHSAHNAVRAVIQNEVYPCIHVDGSEIPVQCTVVQVTSFLNGTIHFVFYFSPCINDVDKQMGSFLNSLLIEVSTLPLLLADGNGTILQSSLPTAHLLGYETVEGITGMNIKQFLTRTSTQQILQSYSNHAASAKSNEALITQEILCNKTGVEFPAKMSTRVVGLHTEETILLLSLKSLEKAHEDSTSSILRSMLELIAVPSVLVNYRGQILYLNTPFLTMFGYSEREDDVLIGKDVSIFMSKRDAAYHPRYMANYFSSHVKYSIDNTIVREARHRNGHMLHVSITVREIIGVSKEAKDTVFVGYFSPAPQQSPQDFEGNPSPALANEVNKEKTNLLLTPSTVSGGAAIASSAPVHSLFSSSSSRMVVQSAMPTEHAGRMVRNLEYWMDEKYGIPLILLGKLGEVLRLSKAAESLLGFFPDEAKGKTLALALSVDPYNQGLVESLDKALEVVTTKTNATYELAITAKTRRGDALFLNSFWRDLSGFRTKMLKDWPDMPAVLICLHNTSAQLSATHQKLLCDTAVETCSKPTIFISTEGIVSVFNPAAEKCFGVLAKDIIGKNVKMIMPQKTADMHDRFLTNYLLTNVSHMIGAPREITAKRMDGSHFSAVIRISDLNALSSRFFIGQLEDITRRKTSEIFAIMSRYMIHNTQSNLLVFDALDELVMVSPPMIYALGCSEESAVLEKRKILSDILPPSTLRLVREFVQPYQRRGENYTLNATKGGFRKSLNTFETLEEHPRRRFASVGLRLPGLVKKVKSDSGPTPRTGDSNRPEGLGENTAEEKEEEEMKQDDNSIVGTVEVHVVLSGNAFVGSVIKLEILLEKDIFQYRRGPIAQGAAKYYAKPLCVVGRNARVEVCNAALAEALGYASAEELEKVACGRLFWELFPSFPLPSGATDLEDESRIFVSIMEQLEHAVNMANDQMRKSSRGNDGHRNPKSGGGLQTPQSARGRRSSQVQQHPVLRARAVDGSGFMLQVSRITTIQHSDRPSTCVRRTESNFSLRLGGEESSQQGRPPSQALFSEPLFFAVELSKISAEDEASSTHLEAAVPLLLAQCPVPMLIANENGMIRQVNTALEKAFDFVADQLVGKSINILMPRGQGEIHDKYMQEYKSARGSRPLMETRIVMAETKTGTPLPLRIHLKEINLDNNTYFIATLTPQK